MKSPNIYTKLTAQIILIFITAMLASFVQDKFHELFGDYSCNGTTMDYSTGKITEFFHFGGFHHDTVIHWGYRHWLWLCMVLSLFAIQLVRITNLINKKS